MANEVIKRGNPDFKQCAFTFDDGPTRLPIEAWLDALEQGGAVGTFFHTGEWIDKFPDKARAIIARGHELAPHTYHHRRMSQVPKEVFFEQLTLVELAFQEATGLPCPTFQRFPSRDYRIENVDWLAEWGYLNIEGEESVDWYGLSSQEIIEIMKPKLDDGAILVMHTNDVAKGTPGALKPLIRSAYEKGLTPVGVSEILKSLGIAPRYRSWSLQIEVPESISYPVKMWDPLTERQQFEQLAAQSPEWWSIHLPEGVPSEREWLNYLLTPLEADGVVEDRKLFTSWYYMNQYWSYVRAGVNGKDLVLLDFATKEPDADALVYVLRWAVKTANELGCSRIVAKQDMRRMNVICQQLGLKSDFEVKFVDTYPTPYYLRKAKLS